MSCCNSYGYNYMMPYYGYNYPNYTCYPASYGYGGCGCGNNFGFFGGGCGSSTLGLNALNTLLCR